MTQLHTIHHGFGIVRPTNDVTSLVRHLQVEHPAWRALPRDHRTQAQLTLDLLANPDPNGATGDL